MGVTKALSKGVDEEGNSANFVETEQIVIRHTKKENHERRYIYSYVQIRGTVPCYWSQD